MKPFTTLIIFFFFSFKVFAQPGQVEGKISDASSGIKLSAVSVEIDGVKSGVTNTEGRFIMSLQSGKKYSIKLSSVGYQQKVIDEVEVLPNQTNVIDFVLERSTRTEQGVIIHSNTRKETAAALIAYQKNTSVVAQVISAETIRR